MQGTSVTPTCPWWSDLDRSVEAIADNDLLATIAGVEDARQTLAEKIRDPSENQPDIDSPESEFLVLDADSSQHRAINRALGGESVVIWGPPGTGKSQTIANLIAVLIAQGRRVLFVAEKRAAIDMVAGRLQRVGLSDLVLDTHGGTQSKRDFAKSMADSIRSIGSIPEPDHASLHRQLSQRRQGLITHKDALHERLPPWNVTLFDVQNGLIGTPKSAQANLRLQSEKAKSLDRKKIDRFKEHVAEWVQLEGPHLGTRYADWAGLSATTPEEAQAAFDLVRDLADDLPKTRRQLADYVGKLGLACPDAVVDWSELVAELSVLFADIKRLLTLFETDIYELDHAGLLAALAPSKSWWKLLARFSSDYREAAETVRATLRSTAKLSAAQALGAVEEAARHWLAWRNLGAEGNPHVLGDLEYVQNSVESLQERLGRLQGLISSEGLVHEPCANVEQKLQRMTSQQNIAANLPRIRELERKFKNAGIGKVTAAVGGEIAPEDAVDALEYVWLQSIWDDRLFGSSNLASFTGSVHDNLQVSFAGLDRHHVEITPQRIKRAAAAAAIAAMNEHPEEEQLVKKEAAKKRRHLPIRRLFAQAPHVLTAIRPCWTMSPLLVAEMIPANMDLFDVVIFDEASQIPPAEAVGSLARAPQAVIAGDDRQLPPTSFFGRQSIDEDDEDEGEDDDPNTALIDDIESILDVVKAGPIREEMLRWHYRSRDARLIAFSNTNLYGEALTTFPGANLDGPISHHLVPSRPLPQRSTRSHPDEVAKVVELVIGHARDHPGESLGVIAFGIHHANNIEETLHKHLREINDHSLDEFFSEDAEERFFVKNIERVQGDERDAVILSVGYHKAANGSLPYRFGPLNQEGGERRLNVAVTRARSRMHVVSSFSHHDMEPGRSSARGVELLRQYLEFAASGGGELGTPLSDTPLNPFELDVLQRLEARGVPVTPQYGAAGYRIDFACAHPREPGRMVLAIEADGAAYHSSPTARDRDRLRQQVLEGLGWRFHRIWSTAWFKNRDEEVDRAVQAWEEAVRRADDGDDPDPPDPSYQPDSSPPSAALASPSDPPPRGPRPNVPPGYPITDYTPRELASLVRWILSDTLLRTDEALMAEMRQELGFKRRGSRIDAALEAAIQRVRGKTTRSASTEPSPQPPRHAANDRRASRDLSALRALLGAEPDSDPLSSRIFEPEPDPVPTRIFEPEPDPKPKRLSEDPSVRKPSVRRKGSKGKPSKTRHKPKETRQKTCALCGRPMVLRNGRYGQFLGCSGFPLFCKHTEPVAK